MRLIDVSRFPATPEQMHTMLTFEAVAKEEGGFGERSGCFPRETIMRGHAIIVGTIAEEDSGS